MKFLIVCIAACLMSFSCEKTYRLDFSSDYTPPVSTKSATPAGDYIALSDSFMAGGIAKEYVMHFRADKHFTSTPDSGWTMVLKNDSLSILKHTEKDIVVVVKNKYVRQYK